MSNLVPKEEFLKKLVELIIILKAPELNEFKAILSDTKLLANEYPTKPKLANIGNIRDTGEKALQRAIVNGGFSLLDFKRSYVSPEKVIWLDLELPVSFNKNPRRMCVDLVGSLDGIPVICELKYFKKSKPDHPLFAFVEILTYWALIQYNHETLDKYQVHHTNMQSFKWEIFANNPFPKVIIAANQSYWNYWTQRLEINKILKIIWDWCLQLDTNVHLFSITDVDFELQKGNDANYQPQLSDKVWTIIKSIV